MGSIESKWIINFWIDSLVPLGGSHAFTHSKELIGKALRILSLVGYFQHAALVQV